jgi:exonuclease III
MLTDVLSDNTADITVIQELRWVESGVMQKRNYDLYYSCNYIKHISRTVFAVNKRVSHLVIGFEPLSMRMCYLRLKGRFFNISIINAHAPTEDKEEEQKEQFYEKLERAYDKHPANDIRITVGDMNEINGKENILRNQAGMYSLHENTSENGNRCQLFSFQEYVYRNTKFNHKIIHITTWKSSDGKTENQKDHLLIDKKHLSNLMDVS